MGLVEKNFAYSVKIVLHPSEKGSPLNLFEGNKVFG